MIEEAKRVLLPLLFFYGVHLASAFAAAGDSSSDAGFVYSSFAGASLTLDGAATVTPRGLLQLTSETALSKGHAFHPTPLRLRGPATAAVRSFSASFVFAIVPSTPGMGGHGLALVIAPSKDLSSGMASNYLGLLNSSSDGSAHNHIVAVELDTIQSPEFHDVDDNHVGVDVNSLVSVAAAGAGYHDDDRAGELRNLTLVSGEAMRAWVDYDGDATRIDVTLAPAGTERPKKPLVSATVDLSTVITADGVAYVGFSSSTGRLSTLHYVLGWSFAVGGPAPAIDMASLPPLPDRRNKSRSSRSSSKTLTIALPVGVGALAVIAMVVVACVVLVVRRRYRYTELREDWEIEFGAHRLAYKDLVLATDGFKDKNLLGMGGFGKVYKGVLPTSGVEVAVKRVWHESEQGMKEFVAEVATIGRLRHRNLVQLLGYCRLKDQLLLVYDYMPNGSLEKHLYAHDENATPVMSWAQRFMIIKGVAAGLLYIHEEWEQVVIHRDVKASNVLLDGEMNARLGDFGLARLRSHDAELLHTTVVAGTFGYIAPELALTGKASPLTDVFAFGAFLLEVVTGRRPVEETGDGDRILLVDWVFEQWRKDQHSLIEVVDPRIQGDCDVNELSLTLRVGLLCSHPLASVRPSMRTVMQYLTGDIPLPELIVPTHMGMSMLALLQSQGFNSSVMATSSSSSSSSSMRSSSTLPMSSTTSSVFAL